MHKQRVSVAVIDDHAVVRAGIARWIDAAEDLEVTGAFESAERFLESLRTHRPDVVLTDIRLPGMSGVELARKLTEKGVAVVLMTSHVGWHVGAAISMENVGYLSKEAEEVLFLTAVRWASRGKRWLDPLELEREMARQRELDEVGLTPTERSVLERLGWSNSLIAADLGMSESTLRKTHLSNIFFKLMVGKRQDAVAWARARKLLLVPPDQTVV